MAEQLTGSVGRQHLIYKLLGLWRGGSKHQKTYRLSRDGIVEPGSMTKSEALRRIRSFDITDPILEKAVLAGEPIAVDGVVIRFSEV